MDAGRDEGELESDKVEKESGRECQTSEVKVGKKLGANNVESQLPVAEVSLATSQVPFPAPPDCCL